MQSGRNGLKSCINSLVLKVGLLGDAVEEVLDEALVLVVALGLGVRHAEEGGVLRQDTTFGHFFFTRDKKL